MWRVFSVVSSGFQAATNNDNTTQTNPSPINTIICVCVCVFIRNTASLATTRTIHSNSCMSALAHSGRSRKLTFSSQGAAGSFRPCSHRAPWGAVLGAAGGRQPAAITHARISLVCLLKQHLLPTKQRNPPQTPPPTRTVWTRAKTRQQDGMLF